MLYNQSYACVLRAKQVYLHVGYVWTYMSKYQSASPDTLTPTHDRKNLVLPEKFLSTSKQPSVSACIASNTLSYG